jgi:hypothetical protein
MVLVALADCHQTARQKIESLWQAIHSTDQIPAQDREIIAIIPYDHRYFETMANAEEIRSGVFDQGETAIIAAGPTGFTITSFRPEP